MTTVYLAGPISGLNYGAATDWRNHAIAELSRSGIIGLSPMRAKKYLQNAGLLTATCAGYEKFGALSTPRGIMTRDRFDATRCDAILVNLLGADRVSVGTVMEIAWADLCRIPIVCVMEKTGNLHEHGMVNEAIGFRVETLDEGLAVLRAILADSDHV